MYRVRRKTCDRHAIEHDTLLVCCSVALLVFCSKVGTILIKIEILFIDFYADMPYTAGHVNVVLCALVSGRCPLAVSARWPIVVSPSK